MRTPICSFREPFQFAISDYPGIYSRGSTAPLTPARGTMISMDRHIALYSCRSQEKGPPASGFLGRFAERPQGAKRPVFAALRGFQRGKTLKPTHGSASLPAHRGTGGIRNVLYLKTEGSEGLPDLPTESFSRGSFC